jgi:hypothetical protein
MSHLKTIPPDPDRKPESYDAGVRRTKIAGEGFAPIMSARDQN